MRDLQFPAIGNGGIFAGDHHLRPHLSQSLNCPRCDSPNTKFCYYNNYNLSQPRHFCKNCRRYWTKGGVLRNVPVGGGCRKTKRSKPKLSPESQKNKNSGSNSSSDGSTLTATVPATTKSSAVFNFPNSSLFSLQNPSFEPERLQNVDTVLEFSGEVLPSTGSFTSLITATNYSSTLGFGSSNPLPFRLHSQQQQQQNKIDEATTMVFDQTVAVDLAGMENKTGNGSLTALECRSNGDQGLCHLLSSADQVYWSESQWGAQDHSLYLP